MLFCIISCDRSPSKISARDITQKKMDIPIQNDINIQIDQVKEQEKKVLIDTLDKRVTLGFQDVYDKLPALQFEKITEKIFYAYKKKYRPKLDTDQSIITISDTIFTINTAKAKLWFTRESDELNHMNARDFCWSEYKGYIKSLHMYVIEDWCNGEFTLGSLFLIDSLSNRGYTIIPQADAPFASPVVSPGNEYFATYVNNVVGDNYFFIGIMKIYNNNGIFSYKEFASAELAGQEIVELVWIDDRSFALKVNKQTYNEGHKTWDDHFSYLKTVLPSSK
jgi:hypothetical protein